MCIRCENDSPETYRDYLLSPEWRSLKRSLFNGRADHHCEECGAYPRVLIAHHLHYNNKYHETLADLMALCQECHDMTHKLWKLEGWVKRVEGWAKKFHGGDGWVRNVRYEQAEAELMLHLSRYGKQDEIPELVENHLKVELPY